MADNLPAKGTVMDLTDCFTPLTPLYTARSITFPLVLFYFFDLKYLTLSTFFL